MIDISVLDALKAQGLKVVSAESCAGGLIATVLSEAPGAAEHFEGGFVVYTPEQKFFALKVLPSVIEVYGTVSREVAVAMAEGALQAIRCGHCHRRDRLAPGIHALVARRSSALTLRNFRTLFDFYLASNLLNPVMAVSRCTIM